MTEPMHPVPHDPRTVVGAIVECVRQHYTREGILVIAAAHFVVVNSAEGRRLLLRSEYAGDADCFEDDILNHVLYRAAP